LGGAVKGVRWSSVIIGVIVTTVASAFLTFVGLAAMYVVNGASGVPVAWPLPLVLVFLAAGAGGYVAARLFVPDAFRSSLLVGLAYLVIQMLALLFRPSGMPWSMQVTYLAVILPAAVVGGLLARGRA
jgi:hypothetical protein